MLRILSYLTHDGSPRLPSTQRLRTPTTLVRADDDQQCTAGDLSRRHTANARERAARGSPRSSPQGQLPPCTQSDVVVALSQQGQEPGARSAAAARRLEEWTHAPTLRTSSWRRAVERYRPEISPILRDDPSSAPARRGGQEATGDWRPHHRRGAMSNSSNMTSLSHSRPVLPPRASGGGWLYAC